VSGYPDVGDTSIPVVRDTDEATVRRALSAVAVRARDEKWTRSDLVSVLEHLGLRAPEKPTGGKTTPIGGNVTPAVQQARRAAKAAQRKAAREQKRKEAS
jgi:hypothetical protein